MQFFIFRRSGCERDIFGKIIHLEVKFGEEEI